MAEPPQPQTMGQPLMAAQAHIAAPPPPPTDINALAGVQELYVRQHLDAIEIFTDIEIANNYNMYLSEQDRETNMRWMMAKENSSCFCRYFARSRRTFDMEVGPVTALNKSDQTVEHKLGLREKSGVYALFKIHRPCTCCLTEMEVTDAQGNPLGRLDENCMNLVTCCPSRFQVDNANGEKLYDVEGPCLFLVQLCMVWPCRDPFTWDVKNVNGESVGSITNVPNGCLKMCFTSADDYVIKFPTDASPSQRALLIAQLFALDYSYFEAKDDRK